MGHVCELQRDLNLAREQLAAKDAEITHQRNRLALINNALYTKGAPTDTVELASWVANRITDLESQLAAAGGPWQEQAAKYWNNGRSLLIAIPHGLPEDCPHDETELGGWCTVCLRRAKFIYEEILRHLREPKPAPVEPEHPTGFCAPTADLDQEPARPWTEQYAEHLAEGLLPAKPKPERLCEKVLDSAGSVCDEPGVLVVDGRWLCDENAYHVRGGATKSERGCENCYVYPMAAKVSDVEGDCLKDPTPVHKRKYDRCRSFEPKES